MRKLRGGLSMEKKNQENQSNRPRVVINAEEVQRYGVCQVGCIRIDVCDVTFPALDVRTRLYGRRLGPGGVGSLKKQTTLVSDGRLLVGFSHRGAGAAVIVASANG